MKRSNKKYLLIALALIISLVVAFTNKPEENKKIAEDKVEGIVLDKEIEEVDDKEDNEPKNPLLEAEDEGIIENKEDDVDYKDTAKNSFRDTNDIKNVSNSVDKNNAEVIQSSSNNNTSSSTSTVSSNKNNRGSYEMRINAYTIDGKPLNKTFTSSKANETFTFYEIASANNKKQTIEVIMNFKGQVVSRKVVKEENLSNAGNKPVTETTKVAEPAKPVITHEDKQSFEDIPFNRVRQQDANMPVGQTKVSQKGVLGRLRITTRIQYVNGVRFGEGSVLKRETIESPRDEIVIEGTRLPLGNSGMEFNSSAEALNWGTAQVKNPNSPWYQYVSVMVSSINHLDTKYTVNFSKTNSIGF